VNGGTVTGVTAPQATEIIERTEINKRNGANGGAFS
jgi:hypothetical protein